MAKTIKFNLKCDNSSIRSLEDLREHFCIQEVLDYYKNGLLARWLNVHGYKSELEQISKIQSATDEDLVVSIATILNVECDENTIKESLAIIEYEKDSNKIHQEYAAGLAKENEILDDYKKRYDVLVNEIVENKDDYSKVKAATEILVEKFKWILDLSYIDLFYKMQNLAPLALFCFVSNEKMRKYYLPEPATTADGKESLDIFINYENPEKTRYYENKRHMYDKLCKITSDESFVSKVLGEKLKSYSQNTDEYWKDIEPDETKSFLILSMGPNARVRALKDKGTELKCNDVNNNFIILKGIDYKNNYNSKLLYMEI